MRVKWTETPVFRGAGKIGNITGLGESRKPVQEMEGGETKVLVTEARVESGSIGREIETSPEEGRFSVCVLEGKDRDGTIYDGEGGN